MNANRVFSAPLIALVRGYQRLISPMSSPSCRFYPSCSAYAVTALTRFGPFRGGWWALRRIARCHPWNAGGVDPVPQTWARRYEVRPEDYRPPTGVDADIAISALVTSPAAPPSGGEPIRHDGGDARNGVETRATRPQTTEELP